MLCGYAFSELINDPQTGNLMIRKASDDYLHNVIASSQPAALRPELNTPNLGDLPLFQLEIANLVLVRAINIEKHIKALLSLRIF